MAARRQPAAKWRVPRRWAVLAVLALAALTLVLVVAQGGAYVTAARTIWTIAGNGALCDSGDATCGDGPSAVDASLTTPAGLAVASDGSVYVSDSGGNRVRRVTKTGAISTVAGTGEACPDPSHACGDGGDAEDAQLSAPQGIAFGSDGALYIADSGADKIRRISPQGTISTVAGTGTAVPRRDDRLRRRRSGRRGASERSARRRARLRRRALRRRHAGQQAPPRQRRRDQDARRHGRAVHGRTVRRRRSGARGDAPQPGCRRGRRRRPLRRRQRRQPRAPRRDRGRDDHDRGRQRRSVCAAAGAVRRRRRPGVGAAQRPSWHRRRRRRPVRGRQRRPQDQARHRPDLDDRGHRASRVVSRRTAATAGPPPARC